MSESLDDLEEREQLGLWAMTRVSVMGVLVGYELYLFISGGEPEVDDGGSDELVVSHCVLGNLESTIVHYLYK